MDLELKYKKLLNVFQSLECGMKTPLEQTEAAVSSISY